MITGDACTILYSVPEALVSLDIPAKLIDSEAEPNETKQLGRKDIITLGGKHFILTLKHRPRELST